MSSDFAIKVNGLSKCFHVYEKPSARIKQFFSSIASELFNRKKLRFYKEYWALRGVSFVVEKGETIGIIGVNGSGKSTLLSLICETLSETAGTIEKNGRVAALLELGSGFNPEFTGKENVYLNASILGLSESEINSRYQAIVEFADIGEFIDRPVKTYSSGMYVRLAFAVIANVDADILIIDEALAVGDALFTQKCMRFLRQFKKRGTILFVSHSSGAVVGLCDRAIWLDQGKVQKIGAAKDVCEEYLAKRYSSTLRRKGELSSSQEGGGEQALNIDIASVADYRDMRQDFINRTNLRNDIKVAHFSADGSSFGDGRALIRDAGLEDLQGRRMSWMVGGEMVRIFIRADVIDECHDLIMGFNLKDSLGQIIFGQNTYVDTISSPIDAENGDGVRAEFTFRMPILPVGIYAVDVAIAEGHPPDVKQLHWQHDAFFLESQASSAIIGLVGVDFEGITLENYKNKVNRD